ncbi:MAG: CPBP family intramembrane metalloprotease [Anaerolineaceae bacterium]|nr:CPBP family intramembrane metalloprotease [Anaerolineaceae bacterium]
MGFFELIITLYLGVMIYFANLADLQNTSAVNASTSYSILPPHAAVVRRMLLGLITMVALFGIYANYVLFSNLSPSQFKEIGISPDAVSISSVLFITVLIAAVTITSFSITLFPQIRQRVRILVGSNTQYNPESQVHLVAMVLALSLVGYLFTNFVLAGGLSGVARSVEENGINLAALVFQSVMFIMVACLGIGLMIRRMLPQALERLGLKIPTPQNVGWGILVGVGLILAVRIITIIWMSLVTPELFAQQTSAAAEIDSQFNTLQAAFLLALSSAISEEILFRGALQPIFGIPLTTLLFVFFHEQYTLTPAMLIILVVGIGLALLRRYQGTTSAIIAHFIYNFVQIALVIVLPQTAHILGLL